MIITKFEKFIIPQTLDGRSFADDYEKQLKEYHCFIARREDTQAIVIEAKYHFDIVLERGGNRRWED